MAEVYKSVGGKSIQKFMAVHKTVQDALDRTLFEAATKAEVMLQETRLNDDPLMVHGASISVEQGNVDRYLVLEDRANAPADLNPIVRNLNSAASIELGRHGGSKTITVRDPETGEFIQKKITWGDMQGLNILGRALGVGSFKKAKVSV
jgi:hypothetical protein